MRDKQRSIIARGLYGGVRPREGSVGGDVSKGRRQKATAASGIDKIFIFLWVSWQVGPPFIITINFSPRVDIFVRTNMNARFSLDKGEK